MAQPTSRSPAAAQGCDPKTRCVGYTGLTSAMPWSGGKTSFSWELHARSLIDSILLATSAYIRGQNQEQNLEALHGNFLYWLHKGLPPGKTQNTSSLKTRLLSTSFHSSSYLSSFTLGTIARHTSCIAQGILTKDAHFLTRQALKQAAVLYCPSLELICRLKFLGIQLVSVSKSSQDGCSNHILLCRIFTHDSSPHHQYFCLCSLYNGMMKIKSSLAQTEAKLYPSVVHTRSPCKGTC